MTITIPPWLFYAAAAYVCSSVGIVGWGIANHDGSEPIIGDDWFGDVVALAALFVFAPPMLVWHLLGGGDR